jgi:hypothetical protein
MTGTNETLYFAITMALVISAVVYLLFWVTEMQNAILISNINARTLA